MIYDLTHTINDDLPVYPGDPHVKVQQVAELDKDGYADRLLTVGTHNGTHIDAPAHMIKGGKKLKDFPAERFIKKAICIDAQNGFDPTAIANRIAGPDLAVLFCTGASEYFNEEKYWHDYLVLNKKTLQVLIDKKASIVGIDTGSFDDEDDFPVHKTLLGSEILLIENLTNLKPLVGKIFELYALPVKLEADGAPARVIAKVD